MRNRVFMHPAAARLFGADGARYLSGQLAANWGQMQFGQPDVTDVHIDAAMTGISIAYRNMDYVGDMVFPRVLVSKESDKYFTFGKGPWMRDEAEIRAPGAQAPRGGYTLSNENYSVDEWSFAKSIDDRERNNADAVLSPDEDAVNFVTDKVDMKLERLVASLVFTGGNWTTSGAPAGGQWHASGGDPFSDVSTQRSTLQKLVGRRPNTIVMGFEVYEQLKQHADLLDRIKYTGTNTSPAIVTEQMMAALFEVERVLVGRAVYDTSAEPAASSMSFVWGKHFWMGYVASAPARSSPSAGYVFTTGRKAYRYREENIHSDVVEVVEAFDEKVTSADAGYLYTNVIA